MAWINWGGRRLQTIGIQSVPLNEEALLATAQKQTQLTDWGDDSFRVGLKIIDGFERRSGLELSRQAVFTGRFESLTGQSLANSSDLETSS